MLIRKDPLLGVLRAIIWFCIGALCFLSFCVLIGAPLSLIFQDAILAHLQEEGKMTPSGLIPAIAFLLVALGAMLIVMTYFFWNLLAITDTVRDGDPFTPENADRLRRMGWLAVSAHVIGFIAAFPGGWIAGQLADETHPEQWSADTGGVGLILILVLFVLARVFKLGAEMREELEGTV